MYVNATIEAFLKLKDRINDENDLLKEAAQKAYSKNAWFTLSSIDLAFKGIKNYLNKSDLNTWINTYDFPIVSQTIGIVMAGNIPMVGFHDLLCILVAGKSAHIKLSSEDDVLIPFLISELIEINPLLEKRIKLVDKLKDVDAVIATGSNNSSRYFEYYFRNIPHIIRKNRTSIGILSGEESTEDLYKLGFDILQFYGLGCRNVSKIYVPKGYDFTNFFEAIQPHEEIIYQSKYVNNYDYNKSIYLVNKDVFKDNGFLLVKEDKELVSPLSVLFYETYTNSQSLENQINGISDNLQVIISKDATFKNSIAFGQSQSPRVWDYADNVDTIKFLISLS